MANINNHASRFRKGLSNPFTAEGRVWCPTCRQDVDHDTQGRHHNGTYAYKRTCCRCGEVLAKGVYRNVPVIGDPLPPAAVTWASEKGVDRR